MKDVIKTIYEIAEPDNITIALVRGDPKEKVNENLDINVPIAAPSKPSSGNFHIPKINK